MFIRVDLKCLPILLLLVIFLSPAASNAKDIDSLLEMDIEQLMQLDVDVTSVNKRPQKLHEAASAIYVVTQEEIRRTGANTIMEALRVVPGLTVSQINQSQYAISARGFNRQYGSNKLLVLMDGRSIYSPSFSGVDWTRQDNVMEDIDRIEVIRGPGAALWGSNAVDGVINIITKSSKETAGVLASGGAGRVENGFGSLRFGGNVQEDLTYRVYGKYRDTGPGDNESGARGYDQRRLGQGGFRSDWQATSKDQFTLQGDFYEIDAQTDSPNRFSSFSPPVVSPFLASTFYSGNNVIGRWNRKLEDNSSFSIQAYYDRAKIESSFPSDSTINQADLEAQYNFTLGESQQLSTGFNYRHVDFFAERRFDLRPSNRTTDLYGFFIHDEIALVPKTWTIIMGAKIEHNVFTGFEFQPNARTIWSPAANHSFWGSVSRAVRLPNPSEDNLSFDASGRVLSNSGNLPLLVRMLGNNDIQAEKMLTYELGYKVNILPTLTFDFAGYLNKYDDLIEFASKTPFLETSNGGVRLVAPFVFENSMKGEAYGFELSSEWRPIQSWRLLASYAWAKVDLREKVPAVLPGGFSAEDDPHHLMSLRSFLDLPRNFELDSMVYYTGENRNRELVPYTRLDMRLGWKPVKPLELSLAGQHLLQDRHAEFTSQGEQRTQMPRSFIAKATFRFK